MSDSGPVGFRVASDKPFLIGLGVLGGSYLLIIVAMVLADLVFLNYADQPLLGNEMVKQGRHVDSGVTVATEKGRRYFFRAGKNETGLRSSGGALFGTELFTATDDEVKLLAVESGRPVTASLRPRLTLRHRRHQQRGDPDDRRTAWFALGRVHPGERCRRSRLGWRPRDRRHHFASNIVCTDSDGAQAGSLGLNPTRWCRRCGVGTSVFHQLSLISCTLTTLFSLGCGAVGRYESVPVSR